MSKKIDSLWPTPTAHSAPKIKTIGLHLASTDRNLPWKIKAAFDFAKSAGQELDLTFSFRPAGRSTPKQRSAQEQEILDSPPHRWLL